MKKSPFHAAILAITGVIFLVCSVTLVPFGSLPSYFLIGVGLMDFALAALLLRGTTK